MMIIVSLIFHKVKILFSVKNMSKKNNTLSSKILTDSNEILKYLQIGISLPIWPEFNKYILHDLNYFNAKSIILEHCGNPAANVLVYSDDAETLYFGYFGTINHNRQYISYLLDELLKYAKKNNYNSVRGPINIPTVIYGWGFMARGSEEDLYAGKPVNPPIYQELFLKRGFQIRLEEFSWEGHYLKFDPYKIQRLDFSKYEYFTPKDWNELMELKADFLKINARNMPDSGKVTPSIAALFDNYADFVFRYGGPFMLFFVRHIPTGKIVACGSLLPNPFRKDAKGRYDSFVAYTWAVDKIHRKNNLIILMWGSTSLQTWKRKLRYLLVVTGNEEASLFSKFAKLVNLQVRRRHLVLDLSL